TYAGFSPDSRLILTTCVDGSARIWDFGGATVLARPERRTFCQDANRYLIVTNNGFQVFGANNDHALSRGIVPEGLLEQTHLSTDGAFVLTISGVPPGPAATNSAIQVWRAETGQPVGPESLISNLVTGAAVSDDGRWVLLYAEDTARIYNA